MPWFAGLPFPDVTNSLIGAFPKVVACKANSSTIGLILQCIENPSITSLFKVLFYRKDHTARKHVPYLEYQLAVDNRSDSNQGRAIRYKSGTCNFQPVFTPLKTFVMGESDFVLTTEDTYIWGSLREPNIRLSHHLSLVEPLCLCTASPRTAGFLSDFSLTLPFCCPKIPHYAYITRELDSGSGLPSFSSRNLTSVTEIKDLLSFEEGHVRIESFPACLIYETSEVSWRKWLPAREARWDILGLSQGVIFVSMSYYIKDLIVLAYSTQDGRELDRCSYSTSFGRVWSIEWESATVLSHSKTYSFALLVSHTWSGPHSEVEVMIFRPYSRSFSTYQNACSVPIGTLSDLTFLAFGPFVLGVDSSDRLLVLDLHLLKSQWVSSPLHTSGNVLPPWPEETDTFWLHAIRDFEGDSASQGPVLFQIHLQDFPLSTKLWRDHWIFPFRVSNTPTSVSLTMLCAE